MGDVTEIILSLRDGDTEGNGTERLFAVVYEQLRGMARKKLLGECPGNTWQPTALVNEAFLKLIRAEDIQWNDRLHFFRAAGQAMQRILIDKARQKKRLKRGGDFVRNALNDAFEHQDKRQEDCAHDRLLDLDEALAELETHAPQRAELVRLYFFAGLTIAQCAELLGVSVSTVERQWRCTKAWLKHRMK